jgi:hypothetical protein
MIKTYSELRSLATFSERYKYLALHGQVGEATFGFDRWMNQQFYRSTQWKQIRDQVIVRDNGCDLGVRDYEVHDRITIHHMNPISAADLSNGDPAILDPEYLISVAHMTHNAIHYGDEKLLRRPLVERRPGDTKLW